MRIRPLIAGLGCLLVLAGTAACSAGLRDDDTLSVVAGFYPAEYLAERIAGGRAKVVNLTPPGVEPHDLELSSRQSAQLVDADLVVYLNGVQPAIDERVGQLADPSAALDIATLERVKPLLDTPEDGETGKDPHVWLDPIRYRAVATALASELGRLDPDGASGYAERAVAVTSDLRRLHARYQAGLADCERDEFVTSHAAFGYLADRYQLRQVPIAGLSPDQEPSPKRLAELARFAKSHQVKVIYFETLASPKLARTLAREVGAETRVLDPVEGVEPGSDDNYLTVMRRNLAALRAGLECS